METRGRDGPRSMNVTLLLADAAQAVEGKLYVLGGGWSLTGPDPAPMALAIKVEVDWDRGNIRHDWNLDLLDADGIPFEVPVAEGAQEAVAVRGQPESGRPPGLKQGTPLDVAMAINFGPLPLLPGQRYEWRFSITGIDQTWSVGFTTRPQAKEQSSPSRRGH
jgi:hypothetical protein